MRKCAECQKPCPKADMIRQIAEGRMYATKELTALLKQIDSGELVEVVRCKDCKKWEYDENFSGWCTEWRKRTLGDHFCSYGERREGE